MTADLLIERGAVLSHCELYRYLLTRIWDFSLALLVYALLNPSRANAEIDDQTVRVCMGRGHRMGFGGIAIVNPFAYRATHPEELWRSGLDPVGGLANDTAIVSQCRLAGMVIAGWGDDGLRYGRAEQVARLITVDAKKPIYCLGTTKAGQPRHPLRIAYSVEPTLWRAAA